MDEFDRLRKSLSSDESSLKVDLSEAVTSLTSVRIDLVKQKRIQRITLHDVSTLKKKLLLEKEHVAALKKQKIRENESITFVRKEYNLQLAKLQRELELCVPKHQLERVQMDLEGKCKKLRQIAEKSIEDVISGNDGKIS